MPAELLQMRGVRKVFANVRALDGVDFTCRAGEIHALMGENGAGKSTLIKVLTGVYQRDGGTIEFEGKAVSPASPHEAEAIGISTVYQEINLVPNLTVADNITLGRQPRRFGVLNWPAMRKRARNALARIGLEIGVDDTLGAHPLAVQQMVAIARALDVDARLLVLDEPTSSLDETETEALFRVLTQLKAEGLGIVFVTHFLDQVYAVSDRITVLRNGSLVGEYPTAELPRLKLISAMIGREFKEATRSSEDTGNTTTAAMVLETQGAGVKGVVHPLDLTLRSGEVLGLAGLLGSGRTEVCKMLFGVTPADSGETRLDGRKVDHSQTPAMAIGNGFGFCSEDRKLEGIAPNLSVRENLILALQARRGVLRQISTQEQEQLVTHYIQALNIKTPHPETPIKNLSGGNQQKVLLARWMCMQPRILILDEPTRGIDIGARTEIEKLVQSLSKKGMSVIYVSSDLEELVRVSERVTVMRDRKQAGELSGASVTENEIMAVIARHT